MPRAGRLPGSPDRGSVISKLTARKRGETDLPLAFTGSVDIIKYTMLHFEESWSLMVRYTLYHAMPSAMLHRASVTRRAAHAADLSDAKRSKLQERSMLTRYKVYNFQPLSAAVASKQSDERAISAFAGDQRVAGRRDPLTPDAAAAMVTYTQIHPWTARHHAPRGGSASASCTSEDLAPFLSEHTAARLGMTPKQGGTGAGKTRSRSVAFLPEVDAGCGSTGAS